MANYYNFVNLTLNLNSFVFVEFTWGQVPFLEFGDKQLAQSNTIARYLANKYKLAGNDEFEAAKCDEMVDALCDLRKEFFKVHFENDETKKAEFKKAFVETQVPKYFGKYNSIIEANGGKWLVGQNPSWADLQVATAVELFEVVLDPVVFDSYPAVKQLKESVFALPQIKTWIEKRPKTEL